MVKRRKKSTPKSIGLTPSETQSAADSAVERLTSEVESDGGAVLTAYREPFGGTTVLLAALPIDRVEPTPFQRDPSLPHVKRLMNVIETLGRFLDPIVAIRQDEAYWTPNGNHRLQAMKKLGARTVIALLVPDPDVAFKILALNTEKAHNLKEKSLETIRMERALAERPGNRLEREFAFEFDQPAFLTLGAAYDKRPRLSGGAYQPVLRRIEDFLDERLPKALAERERRAAKLLAIDDEVSRIVQKLKGRGFTSPYLQAVRRGAHQPHQVFDVHRVRRGRGARQDAPQRVEVQRRQGQAAGHRPGGRRGGGRVRSSIMRGRHCR